MLGNQVLLNGPGRATFTDRVNWHSELLDEMLLYHRERLRGNLCIAIISRDVERGSCDRVTQGEERVPWRTGNRSSQVRVLEGSLTISCGTAASEIVYQAAVPA